MQNDKWYVVDLKYGFEEQLGLSQREPVPREWPHRIEAICQILVPRRRVKSFGKKL